MCTVTIKKKNATIKLNKILISGVDPATTIQKNKDLYRKMHAGKESEMMLIIALERV